MHFTSRHTALAAALVIATGPAFSQAPSVTPVPPASQAPARSAAAPVGAGMMAGRPCTSVSVDPPTFLTLGKSRVVRLDFPASRIVVGGSQGSRAGRPVNLTPLPGQPAAPQGQPPAAPAGMSTDGVADTEITLLGPNELFFLGRKTGSMNVVLQGADGRCVVKDIVVTVDPDALQGQLALMLPEETGVKVRGAENSIVLTGTVTDAVKLDQILSLAASYGDSKKLVNLMRVTAPQQVMLEVQIAEVSKTLLDKLGSSVNLSRSASSGLNTFSLVSSFLSGGGGLLQALRIGRGSLAIDAQKDDGLVRVLAEPNIMAISGQSASFLSGGKIFIPVAQTPSAGFLGGGGGTTITLEEKEFGVGLKFTPTVLDGRINLKVVSEVSELSQTGTPFSTINGVTAILPSLSTRRVDTTVQLADGQSYVIAGLIKNNVTEALKRIPGLGDVPVMGALFRSTEFQTDQTELMFVVTPRLVKPLTAAVMLPTDNHTVPNRGEVLFMGRVEGAAPPPARPAGAANEAAPVPTVTAVVPPSATPVQAPVEPPANLVPTASTSAVNTSVVEAAPLLPVSGRQ